MDAMEQYKIAKAEMKVAMEKANKVVQEAFKNAAKSLFMDNPDLISFGWNQYTPYFNDGDPCNFSVNLDYPSINGVAEAAYEASDEDKPKVKKLENAVCKFLGVFAEEDYETMFGDHCEITVTREEIEVEEYEHD